LRGAGLAGEATGEAAHELLVATLEHVLRTNLGMSSPSRTRERNALLRSLDADRADVPARPAFRLELLDAALEPLEPELDADDLERLKTALSILIGTEAMFAMRDVLRLDHEQARESGEWAVRQMVRAARHPD
jgi:hypothetical protein